MSQTISEGFKVEKGCIKFSLTSSVGQANWPVQPAADLGQSSCRYGSLFSCQVSRKKKRPQPRPTDSLLLFQCINLADLPGLCQGHAEGFDFQRMKLAGPAAVHQAQIQ